MMNLELLTHIKSISPRPILFVLPAVADARGGQPHEVEQPLNPGRDRDPDDASPEVSAILPEQRAQLAERIRELQRVDERLARMSQAHERGILLTDAEQIATFGNDWDPEQSQTARTLWGRSAQ
ncbi:hypothetical protein [Streptomyces sp. NPDC046862]|uniref:hypothetical protein n=1 Tax=Streptomyces sp. NPDC046862 TaxID=3154603 RepID=UPI0034540A4F